ncbi:MAG: stage II sporulation protein P [Bacillota bacterium]|jgi:stage II sporulation protein P
MLFLNNESAEHDSRGILAINGTRYLQKPAELLRRFLGLEANITREILHAGIPGLSSRMTEVDRPPSKLATLSTLWFELSSGVNRHAPVTFLAAQLPMFGEMLPAIASQIEHAKNESNTASKSTLTQSGVTAAATLSDQSKQQTHRPSQEEQSEQKQQPPASPAAAAVNTKLALRMDEPLILVLHTHTSECYLPTSGETHLFNGQGDIVKVGKRLTEVLNDKYQIPTIHCDKIHDQYPWHEAYQRSQVTIKEYLTKYPSIKIVIDVHRDGTPGLEHSTVIDGKRTARVMLVIGTNRMGLEHPHWEKNLAFAEKVKAETDRLYPGLSLGIIKADARYNQHLCNQAIIAEMGGENCTLEEALLSASCFAEVLASIVQKEFSF